MTPPISIRSTGVSSPGSMPSGSSLESFAPIGRDAPTQCRIDSAQPHADSLHVSIAPGKGEARENREKCVAGAQPVCGVSHFYDRCLSRRAPYAPGPSMLVGGPADEVPAYHGPHHRHGPVTAFLSRS